MDMDFSKYLSFILIFKGSEGGHKKDLQRPSLGDQTKDQIERRGGGLAADSIPDKGLTKELTGFASARLMPKWPSTVARVFNRLYISKSLRLTRFGHFNRARLDRCYDHQRKYGS